MTDLLVTLGNLIASLGNAQSLPVLKERLALVQDQLALVNKETMQLREELQRTTAERDEAKNQLAAKVRTEQFTQHRGALFRRDAAGRYERVVYCPKCQHSTSAFPPGEAFACDPCRWFSSFTEQRLQAVLAELS